MSGLARILNKKNISVSGSDLSQNPLVEQLQKEGVEVHIGHSASHVKPESTIVYSSGVPENNPEYQAALEMECSILHRSDLLKLLMEEQKTLAVAGTHGKTTTSSLLTAVLVEAELDPSFAIGGMIPQLETNADSGSGDYFVAEADESDGTFLKYHPYGAILTNIGIDHMNYFGAIETLLCAFQTFIEQVENSDLFFWCADDERLSALKPKGFSYGFSEEADLRGSNYLQRSWSATFDIEFQGRTFENIEIALTGKHNARNAMAVFGIALNLGVSEKSIREAFRRFGGVKRRCEKKAEAQTVLVLDDYAHHPSEIKTTLSGVRRAIEERRLIVVFQPHRYSRTKDCLNDYASIFREADLLFVTDIYAAGEEPIEGVTPERLIESIHGKMDKHYSPREELLDNIWEHLRPHDVVITLGAGDITHLGGDLVKKLRKDHIRKWKVGLVFGGRSHEHEISLKSAQSIAPALSPSSYDISYYGINKEGNWALGKEHLETEEVKGSLSTSEAVKEIEKCDILFSILHGPFGEDGTVQGFFEMLDKPYVGCCHRSAAVSMDKALSKRLMMLHGIATSPFIDFTENQWKENPEHYEYLIHQQLRLPLFVKPVHLGSSVGVTKVETWEELPEAIAIGFQYDNQLLVENGIDGRELEFAIYGNDNIHCYPPGEIILGETFYDYDAKYGAGQFSVTPRAELPEDLIEEGMFLAEKAYQAVECSGMARVDFFLDSYGRFWFNEVNPIPGFTSNSLYPMICAENDLPMSKLLDKLIVLGFQRKRAQRNYSVVL